MNKKGFTLIELLAVIVILGVIISISIINLQGVKKKTDIAMFSEKVEFAVSAAQKYYEEKDRKETLSDSNQRITVEELITAGAYTIETKDSDGNYAILDSSKEKRNVNDLTICVYMKYNRVYACVENTNENLSSDPNNKGRLYEITSSDTVEPNYICSNVTC